MPLRSRADSPSEQLVVVGRAPLGQSGQFLECGEHGTRARCASGGGSGSSCMRSATRSQLALHASASVRSTGSVVSALRARRMVRSSAGSSSRSSTNRVQRSSNASCDAMSSSTCTRGGRPASTGCSARMRCANACRVDTAAASSSSNATVARVTSTGPPSRATTSSARRMRSRSSAAAFSVNVTAAISRIGHVAFDDERHDAVDQCLRLARPRTGFHEQRLVERCPRSRREWRGLRRARRRSAGPRWSRVVALVESGLGQRRARPGRRSRAARVPARLRNHSR